MKKYKKKATKLSLKGYRIKDDEDVPTDEKNREIVIAEKDELS
jgi:hypothetical protein